MNLRDLYLPQIGDRCVGINFTRDTERNDMTCEVIDFIEVLEHTKSNHGDIWTPGTYYVCQWADGAVGAVALHNLKPAEAK